MKRLLPGTVAVWFGVFLLGLSFSVPVYAVKNNEVNDALSANPAPTEKQVLSDSDISRFTNAITQIKEFYVKNIDDKKLLEDAIRGMLTGLDPHSEYLDEDSYKTLLMATNGEFAGVGIEVTGEFGVLKVVSPIDDTPAAKAGVKSGDYIVAIDGKQVSDMTLSEAVDKMRGKKGTPVALTVIRKGEKNPIAFKLTRDTIRMVSVKSNMMDNGFGYVRISQFQEPTTELLITAVENLKKSSGGNVKGLIIDLRNNPGGLLETAVQVADLFLSDKALNRYSKVIVYTEGRQPKSLYKAKGKPTDLIDGAPIVVLMNEGSASASEILAGALQDYHRAVIVGMPSFGKGSVQTVLPLDQTHAIKLTTALYHTPAGRVIQNVGIKPDIIIENLKITDTSKADLSMLAPVKEFQLKGHLPGTKTTSNTDASLDTLAQNQKDSTLAQSDFQLYEALKILKSMAFGKDMLLINSTSVAKNQ